MTEPAVCYCGCPFEAHRDGATNCATCTTCRGYAERTEVAGLTRRGGGRRIAHRDVPHACGGAESQDHKE